MMLSCVLALTIEDNGSVLKAEDLSEFITNDKIINGHSPMIDKYSLNAYMNCNVKTDIKI
ncbi:hypothetical protein ACTFIN_03785 [Clostridium cagae]|uniref:hypothetical protein n=1 Tax=Clostridium cagae TaxID=2080751 RepID=UPI0013F014ED|nr:hypothetical protein [Clostridium botulinum]